MSNDDKRLTPEEKKQKLVARIENDFTYHAPHGDQVARYGENRSRAKDFALFIAENTPVSREQSLALTALEEAVFWLNASIARNEQPS